jgi:FkbM family methyltransferase
MTNFDLSSAEVVSVGKPAKVFGVASDAYFAELLQNPGVDIWGHVPTFMRVARGLPQNGTIIDIGANIGLTALAGSRLVRDGKVVAVEPSPLAFAALAALVNENSLSNVEVISKCIGAAPGRVSFVQNDNFLAGSYVGSDAREDTSVDVEMTTLDHLTYALRLPSVDLVKIDVEGFELDVLLGGTKAIEDYNPTFVVEFNAFAITANRNASPRAMLDFIIDRFGSFKVIRGDDVQEISTPLQVRDFIYSNMAAYHCVDDIIFGRDIPIIMDRC